MKQIVEVLERPLNGANELARTSTHRQSKPLSEDWISALFAKLKAIYTNRWTDRFCSERDVQLARSEWSEGLRGMTGDQIKAALERCRIEYEWPPSSPAEFRNRGVLRLTGAHRPAEIRHLPKKSSGLSGEGELKRIRKVLRQAANVSIWSRLNGHRIYC